MKVTNKKSKAKKDRDPSNRASIVIESGNLSLARLYFDVHSFSCVMKITTLIHFFIQILEQKINEKGKKLIEKTNPKRRKGVSTVESSKDHDDGSNNSKSSNSRQQYCENDAASCATTTTRKRRTRTRRTSQNTKTENDQRRTSQEIY